MDPSQAGAPAPGGDPSQQAPQDPQQEVGQLMSAVDQLTNIVQQQQQQFQQLSQAFPQIQQQMAAMQGELKQTSQMAQAAAQEIAQLAKAMQSQPDMPAGMQDQGAAQPDPAMGGGIPQQDIMAAGGGQPGAPGPAGM